MRSDRDFDLLVTGRAGLDLYSQDVGAPFEEITGFAAYVGGSPTNVAVGAGRLGLRVAILTAVGDDPVGDFILSFLRREGIETRWATRKTGYRTGAALLAIQPPDHFPLVYYRDRAADKQLDIDDVEQAPLAASSTLLLSGTSLSEDPSRSAMLFAAWKAQKVGTEVVLDLDFRADQWHDPRAFGVAIRSALPLVDVVLGSDDELNAATLVDPSAVRLKRSQVTDARISGDTEQSIEAILELGSRVVVRKRGAAGSSVVVGSDTGAPPVRVDVPGFEAKVENILGAGDAFAAGIIYGRRQGWEWPRAVRFANACGALVVTRHGCSASMPRLEEVEAFMSNSPEAHP